MHARNECMGMHAYMHTLQAHAYRGTQLTPALGHQTLRSIRAVHKQTRQEAIYMFEAEIHNLLEETALLRAQAPPSLPPFFPPSLSPPFPASLPPSLPPFLPPACLTTCLPVCRPPLPPCLLPPSLRLRLRALSISLTHTLMCVRIQQRQDMYMQLETASESLRYTPSNPLNPLLSRAFRVLLQ